MDVKKATTSRLAALKSAMASGAGQPPQSDDDVMQSPQNAPGGDQDPDAQGGEGAPPPADDGGEGSGMDPVGSISEAQDAIQQALGQSDDPEDHQSLSKANDLLQQAATILQKHYDQEGQEPDGGGPDDDEEASGPGGQSEGTDYQGDGK